MRQILAHLGWPHELLHFGAARALGVRARVENNRVVFAQSDNWRVAAILLAPAATGLVALLLCVAGWAAFAHTLNEHLLWSCGVWFWAWWLAACASDLADVWRFLRSGQWTRYAREENTRGN